MIDFSHANSLKQCQRQLIVGDDVCGQIANGDHRIMGVMIESHLKAGSQKVIAGQPLVYGQSITDGCLSWDDTVPLLRDLASAVLKRRTVDPNRSLNYMMIYINGETREVSDNSRVADVIADMGLTGKKIAVELNKEILPFNQYQAQALQAEDRLEIVHAIGGGQDDSFVLAGVTYHSRLLVGTGKYKDLEETRLAIEASGAQIVTVAIRRTNIGQNPGEPNLLDVISPDKYTILPNTAGCYTAEDAVRTCRLGRELLGGHKLVKLEVLSRSENLVS